MNISASLSYLRFILFARVIPSFLVQRNGTDEFFTIEPRVNGLYKKFINNDGHATPLGEKCAVGQKSLAFVHWSWSFTRGKFLICDVQGKESDWFVWSVTMFIMMIIIMTLIIIWIMILIIIIILSIIVIIVEGMHTQCNSHLTDLNHFITFL